MCGEFAVRGSALCLVKRGPVQVLRPDVVGLTGMIGSVADQLGKQHGHFAFVVE